MNTLSVFIRFGMLVVLLSAGRFAFAQPEIPDPLKDWEAWATWDLKHRDCPTPYHSSDQHICFWPTGLAITADEEGRLKAQVRAGKWIIALHAFRASDPGEIAFAESATPITDRELVAFKARPEFRLAEFEGLRPVEVFQTTFPEKWRTFPVFEWETDSSFRLVEKMRGMSLQRPEGLAINREFWLDEDGRGLTFRDMIQGRMQQVWRLDMTEGQELGAVRVDGKGQLITRNPTTGADGVEIRARRCAVGTGTSGWCWRRRHGQLRTSALCASRSQTVRSDPRRAGRPRDASWQVW